jgi:hypothetical protein
MYLNYFKKTSKYRGLSNTLSVALCFLRSIDSLICQTLIWAEGSAVK